MSAEGRSAFLAGRWLTGAEADECQAFWRSWLPLRSRLSLLILSLSGLTAWLERYTATTSYANKVRDNIVYQLLPFVALAYPLGLCVPRRSAPTARDWVVGLALSGSFVGAASMVMRGAFGARAPVGRLLAAYASLYVLPMIIMLLAVYILRVRLRLRWIGGLVLLATFAAIVRPVVRLSGTFINLSESVE